jgi:glutathione S-transferase
MKLYMHPMSSNARRARLVAKHLDLRIEEELVDLAKGAQRQAPYLAINPNGKVPTLVDGDLTLWECYAIMIYLSEKSGKRELYPEDFSTRTEIHRWLFWCANEWAPVVGKLNFENMLKPMLKLGAPDPARVAELEAAFKQHAKVLDTHLAQRVYLLGDKLSLGDYAVAASLSTVVPAKLPLAGFTNVERWFAAIQTLPAWAATAS